MQLGEDLELGGRRHPQRHRDRRRLRDPGRRGARQATAARPPLDRRREALAPLIVGDGRRRLQRRGRLRGRRIGERRDRRRPGAGARANDDRRGLGDRPRQRVDNDVTIGERVRVQTNCYLTAGTVVEDDVFIGPGVMTTNDDTMGRHPPGTTARRPDASPRLPGRGRSGAVPGVEIGEEAFIAAGAVVDARRPPRAVVMGVPARVVRDVPKPATSDRWHSRRSCRAPERVSRRYRIRITAAARCAGRRQHESAAAVAGARRREWLPGYGRRRRRAPGARDGAESRRKTRHRRGSGRREGGRSRSTSRGPPAPQGSRRDRVEPAGRRSAFVMPARRSRRWACARGAPPCSSGPLRPSVTFAFAPALFATRPARRSRPRGGDPHRPARSTVGDVRSSMLSRRTWTGGGWAWSSTLDLGHGVRGGRPAGRGARGKARHDGRVRPSVWEQPFPVRG